MIKKYQNIARTNVRKLINKNSFQTNRYTDRPAPLSCEHAGSFDIEICPVHH